MEQFEDIRPYHDNEVHCVLHKLIKNSELVRMIAAFNFPKTYPFLKSILAYFVKKILTYKFSKVNSIQDFQKLIEQYVIKVINKTTTDVNWSGLNQLKHNKPYLFLSNHRDIVLDPALLNYGLHKDNRGTVRVAIGDNLLEKDYVSDLMRLNKSFIVKRSEKSRRDKLNALKVLSAYISHSIETGHSVWMAHREGRAKDGNDRTDSAIIKMLFLHYKNKSLSDMLQTLNIVPVSISYEIDPCDYMKAKELYIKETSGSYIKEKEEDMKSIASGIQGQKGEVHVAFGKPLPKGFESIPMCVQAIDKQIHSLYKLYSINYAAYEKLNQMGIDEYQKDSNWKSSDCDFKKGVSQLEQRMNLTEPKAHLWLLKLYANPLKNAL